MAEEAKTAEILTPFGDYKTPAANADLVECLEDWLARAKRGEIIAIAVAGIAPNDNCFTNWQSGPHSNFTILGIIEVLKDDILSRGRD